MLRKVVILLCAVAVMVLILLFSESLTRRRESELSFFLQKGVEGVVFVALPRGCEDVRFAEMPADSIEKLAVVRVGEERVLALSVKRPLENDTVLRFVCEEGKKGKEESEVNKRVGERKYEMLIITDRSFVGDDVFRRFVLHKEKRGLRVIVKTIEEIVGDRVEGEEADRLREGIVEEWRRSRFVYLLIIGSGAPSSAVVDLRRFGVDFTFHPNAKSRFYLGTCVRERPVIAIPHNKATVFLSRDDLRAGEDGETAFLYLNGAEAGEAFLLLYRQEGGVWRCVKRFERFGFGVGFNEIRVERFFVRRGDIAAIHIISGSVLGVPVEGEGTHYIEGESEQVNLSDAKPLNLVPLFQLECFRTPQVAASAIPMKILYPMGTYSAFGRAYFLDSHFHDCPTDYYYSALDGEFDRDGDGYAGEALGLLAHFDEKTGFFAVGSGDGAIPLPDVAVGRIPFDVETEREKVRSVLTRVIEYEDARGKEGKKPEMLLAVEPLAPDTKFEKLPELLRGVGGWKVRSLFAEERYKGEVAVYCGGYERVIRVEEIEKNPFASAEALVSLWRDANPRTVFLISHGNCDRLGNILPLRRLDVKERVEPPFLKFVEEASLAGPSFVFITGCNSAQPERYYLGFRRSSKGVQHDWEERRIVAEELLAHFAMGVVAPTRSAWFTHGWRDDSDGGIVTLLKMCVEEFAEGMSLGLVLRNAQRRYARLFGKEFTEAANIAGLVLYGDPSLSLEKGTVAIVSEELPDGVVGKPYEGKLEGICGGGKGRWQIVEGRLPQGLVFSGGGDISGVPEEDGEFSFTVSLNGANGGSCKKRFLLRVKLEEVVLDGGSVKEVQGAREYEILSAKIQVVRTLELPVKADVWKAKNFSLEGGVLVSATGFNVRAEAEYENPLLILSEKSELSFAFECEMERGDSFASIEVVTEDGEREMVWYTTGDGRIVALGEPLVPVKRTAVVPLNRFAGRMVRLLFRYVSNEEYSKKPKGGIRFSHIKLRGVLSELRFENLCRIRKLEEKFSFGAGDFVVCVRAYGSGSYSEQFGFVSRGTGK
ncbi:MAG: C25 family cysteine peptidase [Planctomycetota bacterium]|nr:C25 family cysteine peptidase [Planctomycetota bacterium]